MSRCEHGWGSGQGECPGCKEATMSVEGLREKVRAVRLDPAATEMGIETVGDLLNDTCLDAVIRTVAEEVEKILFPLVTVDTTKLPVELRRLAGGGEQNADGNP